MSVDRKHSLYASIVLHALVSTHVHIHNLDLQVYADMDQRIYTTRDLIRLDSTRPVDVSLQFGLYVWHIYQLRIRMVKILYIGSLSLM